MSQEKVDKYKDQKLRRREIMKKQRRMHIIRTTVVSIAALALVGWLGYSAFEMFVVNQPRESVVVDYSAVDEYLGGLTQAQ